jgi:hypothetical protein
MHTRVHVLRSGSLAFPRRVTVQWKDIVIGNETRKETLHAPRLFGDVYTSLLMTGCSYTRLRGFALELRGRARAGRVLRCQETQRGVTYILRQPLSSCYCQRTATRHTRNKYIIVPGYVAERSHQTCPACAKHSAASSICVQQTRMALVTRLT